MTCQNHPISVAKVDLCSNLCVNDAHANVSSSNCKCLNYFHDKAIYAFKRDTKDSPSLHVYVLDLVQLLRGKCKCIMTIMTWVLSINSFLSYIQVASFLFVDK